MTPQYIEINHGNKFYYKYRDMTIIHREDGPAIELASGSKYWYTNGKYHREDGPAIELASGSKYWYTNGKYHREDGPAVELASGSKYWYTNGKYHREDGPAVEYADGFKMWCINGHYLSEEEFLKQTSPEIILTLDEIAAKLGIEVGKLKIKK